MSTYVLLGLGLPSGAVVDGQWSPATMAVYASCDGNWPARPACPWRCLMNPQSSESGLAFPYDSRTELVRPLIHSCSDRGETYSDRMRVSRQHRLDPVTYDLGQVGVVDANGTQVRDVAVAALMGTDV